MKTATANNPSKWSLPKGRLLLRALRNEPWQEYLVYLPVAERAEPRILLAVHGINRNAIEQAKSFAEICERQNVVLVVPVFEPDLHSDYQRLGRQGRGVRADLALNRCLDEVALLTGADVSQFAMFGFSGGAQFVHRYAMAHPHRVKHAVLAAAGWYTFPDNTQRFPYGIRTTKRLPRVNFDPEQFLHIGFDVIVGEDDTGTTNVRRTERTIRQQGTTRVERAERWVAAMKAATVAFGLEPNVSLTKVSNADHSFEKLCAEGGLVDKVEQIFTSQAGASTNAGTITDSAETQEVAARG